MSKLEKLTEKYKVEAFHAYHEQLGRDSNYLIWVSDLPALLKELVPVESLEYAIETVELLAAMAMGNQPAPGEGADAAATATKHVQQLRELAEMLEVTG